MNLSGNVTSAIQVSYAVFSASGIVKSPSSIFLMASAVSSAAASSLSSASV